MKIGRLEGVAKVLSRVFQKFKFGLPSKCNNRGVSKSGSLLLWGSPDRLLQRYYSCQSFMKPHEVACDGRSLENDPFSNIL